MALVRPVVKVHPATDENKTVSSVALPHVMMAPIRPDIINFVYTRIKRNNTQAHSVDPKAGHRHSAESWGTGRAVSRIPRISGGGTHRAGQGAFGNMCRGGRMFQPIRVWRKWHRKVNLNERRYAVVSAIAASAVPALVMARGHLISQVPEVPLVISNEIESFTKTKQAIQLLRKYHAIEDVHRCKSAVHKRAGKGKARNRRYVGRVGPLIVYKENNGICRAFRNLPGVDVLNVCNLSLLHLAPGGRPGRFIIWTESAFHHLETLYGDWARRKSEKKGYTLPRFQITNADVHRLINSDEIQKAIRPKKRGIFKPVVKRNPLKNRRVLRRLNPYGYAQLKGLQKQEQHRHARKLALKKLKAEGKPLPANVQKMIASRKASEKAHKSRSRKAYAMMMSS